MQKDTLLQTENETAKLVDAFTTNNEAVLKTIYQENFHKVRTYVLQNKGSEHHAKDIYQDAFIAIWKKIKNKKLTTTDLSALNGYLYTIAKNKWIDFLRSPRNKKMVPTSKINGSANVQAESQIDEDHLENDNKLERAMLAFTKLGAECKILLTKVYFENKSMNEIGVELNLDAASARNKKYRCMQKLRELAFNK